MAHGVLLQTYNELGSFAYILDLLTHNLFFDWILSM